MTWTQAARKTVARRLSQAHRAVEDKTGLVFGYTPISAYTTSGYPLSEAWLVIAPPSNGFDLWQVSVKGHSVYFGRGK